MKDINGKTIKIGDVFVVVNPEFTSNEDEAINNGLADIGVVDTLFTSIDEEGNMYEIGSADIIYNPSEIEIIGRL
jgi:hypothetical protein